VSILAELYPHLVPGRCGRLQCPSLCPRFRDCPAGVRRSRAERTANVWRQFTVVLDRRRAHICEKVHDAGFCPTLCREVGGCFLPRVGDHPSEASRKVFRAQRAMDALVRARDLKKKEVLP